MKNSFLLALLLLALLLPSTLPAEAFLPDGDDLSSIDEDLLPVSDDLFLGAENKAPIDEHLSAIAAHVETTATHAITTATHTMADVEYGVERSYPVHWNGCPDEDFNPWSFIVVPFESTVADYDNNADFCSVSVTWNWMPFKGLWSEDLQDYSNFGSDIDNLPGNRDPAFQELAWRTNYINNLHFILFGMLALAPNDFTNWDDEDKDLNGAYDRWKENVKNGPVMDEDDGVLNWIAHPWMGSGYYVMARHCGMSKWDSFFYSAFASTVLWEYGLESVAEVPSIQDLVITPVIGSLVGELVLREEAKIKANGRRVLGSKVLGGIVLWLFNPFYIISSSMASDWNKVVPGHWKTEFFRDVHIYPESFLSDASIYERNIEREELWGFRWKTLF